MTDQTRNQAKGIFLTVRMIQERVIRQHAQKQRAEGEVCAELSFPQFNAVMAVRDRGAVTIKELAEALQVSAPSASAMVDRLVEMGILTREQSQVDRREVVVSVSERGCASLSVLEEQILQAIESLLEKLGPEDARQWAAVYERIRSVIQAEQSAQGV